MNKTSVILLAGGIGSRMGSSTPKQFLLLNGRPIAHYSLDFFLSLPWIQEVVVVAESHYTHYFEDYKTKVTFASPGKERQYSVFNGLEKVCPKSSWVCIHDSARPFIKEREVSELYLEAQKIGAAALGVPVKFTVKQCCDFQNVIQTLPRSQLWEIQTPQIISYELLKKAFKHCHDNQLQVTDDVSLIEHLNLPVKIVKGEYYNIKITTPEDLLLGETIFQTHYGPIV